MRCARPRKLQSPKVDFLIVLRSVSFQSGRSIPNMQVPDSEKPRVIQQLRKALEPARAVLRTHTFLGGETPLCTFPLLHSTSTLCFYRGPTYLLTYLAPSLTLSRLFNVYSDCDYVLFSTFIWIRSISPTSAVLLDPSDPVYAWRTRMLDLFEGLGRMTFGYHEYQAGEGKGRL